jgi:ABC-type uncharacterized transport system substrate-binding protein
MKRAAVAAALATTVLWAAFGHPHVFMDTRIEVAWDEDGLSGFWITWGFDKAFTASILMDFDRDKNERLSPAEVASVEANAFSNLVNYRYFLYIRSSRGLHRPTAVQDFTAYTEGERMRYRFFVPYSLPVGDREVVVNVAVYDETFFCDIGYAETAPVLFSASQTFRGGYDIREDRGIRIEYMANDSTPGFTFPRQVVLTLRREL